LPSTTRQLAVACARACEEKKAGGIVVLDVRKLTFISDYFVVCSAANERQAKAITESCKAAMKAEGIREHGLEGQNEGRWLLQDFVDVVVHVFHEAHREFYDLEGLWADAPRVRWKTKAAKA
jgi:ribosome-associated protein